MLEEVAEKDYHLDLKDVKFTFYRSTGAGGQHRNKTDSACRATHIPTGIVARAENDRSQHVNKEVALAALRSKLSSSEASAKREQRNQTRREHQGSGMRGDKIRTIRVQDNTVTCHRTNKKYKVKQYLKGDLSWF